MNDGKNGFSQTATQSINRLIFSFADINSLGWSVERLGEYPQEK